MAITQLTGKQIKDQSIDLTTDVTGVLPTANGGTGSMEITTLTGSTTVTWDVSQQMFPQATLSLGTSNKTLSIINPTSGMRGILYISSLNGKYLTLPSGSVGFTSVSAGSYGQKVLLRFYYDGTNYFWINDGTFTM